MKSFNLIPYLKRSTMKFWLNNSFVQHRVWAAAAQTRSETIRSLWSKQESSHRFIEILLSVDSQSQSVQLPDKKKVSGWKRQRKKKEAKLLPKQRRTESTNKKEAARSLFGIRWWGSFRRRTPSTPTSVREDPEAIRVEALVAPRDLCSCYSLVELGGIIISNICYSLALHFS